MSTNLSTENQSQKFHSDLFGDLTVLTHADGSLWFIGKEVAEKLGYEKPAKMYDRIDEEDKQTLKRAELQNGALLDSLGFEGNVHSIILINESGLYVAVLGSKKPEAKEFKRWVTKDILPSIRKTGGYQQEQQVGYDNALKLLGVPTEIVPAIAKVYEERDEAIKHRHHLDDKRAATALGKLARANDKIKQLEMVAKLETNLADKIEKVTHATILAIQSRVSNFTASGLKLGNYCRKNGLEIKNIPEPRFGVVHSYPAEAWQNVYNVNINSILGV